MKNIKKLLQEKQNSSPQEVDCCDVKQRPAVGSKKRNIHVLLFKLSFFSKIRIYFTVALLLYIAAALFLHLETELFVIFGFSFLAGAMLATLWTAAMLFCKVYYKRNPQRLVTY